VESNSAYLNDFLNSWSDFLKKVEAAFPLDKRHSLTVMFAKRLCLSFTALIDEILTGIRKTEEGLKRFKRSNPKASKESDEDRIRKQFQLDIEFFGQRLDEVISNLKDSFGGINDESSSFTCSKEYQDLKALIAANIGTLDE
jgi:hypothetical protein